MGHHLRLTTAQALVRYLAAQESEIDGKRLPFIAGVFAIFGHGNVAGLGEALAGAVERLPTLRAHNEQAMAHAAIAFAKAMNRRRTRSSSKSKTHAIQPSAPMTALSRWQATGTA
jgi:3D-(3,5/4)-trihydroxycyclohexane-1,2-dione acylhydrolase (decyclizing)